MNIHRVFLLSILISGCSSTYLVVPDDRAGGRSLMTRARLGKVLNETAIFTGTTIVLRNGEEADAQGIHLRPDSVFFFDNDMDGNRAVATSEILRIERTDRYGGLLEGAFFGALSGTGLALALSAISSINGDAGHDGMGTYLVLVGGSVGGGAIGLVAGTVSGHIYTYEFAADSTSPRHAPGPFPLTLPDTCASFRPPSPGVRSSATGTGEIWFFDESSVHYCIYGQ